MQVMKPLSGANSSWRPSGVPLSRPSCVMTRAEIATGSLLGGRCGAWRARIRACGGHEDELYFCGIPKLCARLNRGVTPYRRPDLGRRRPGRPVRIRFGFHASWPPFFSSHHRLHSCRRTRRRLWPQYTPTDQPSLQVRPQGTRLLRGLTIKRVGETRE